MVERILMKWANCYVLTGKDGSILIDSSSREDGPQILGLVENKNVKLILLTHGHFDHVGSAAFLSQKLRVPIAMSKEDIYLIGNGQASILKGYTFVGRVMSRYSRRVLKRRYTRYLRRISLLPTDRRFRNTVSPPMSLRCPAIQKALSVY